MATYIKGVTDYIPALEPFKPDYKFLSDVLSVRQDRYDTNYKQLNDLYSKVVYAPLSRSDNAEKRDQYANRLSNGLKQVSGLDLSLQQNVDVAKGLFKPFFEDKSLIKDMAATKLYAKENQRANSYLNSPDQNVVRQYWDTGVQGLQMWMDKYKNATAEEALTMGMPQYVPNPDLYNKAFESLKDSGLKIKQTTLDGDWIVTTENGTALTRQIVGYKRDENDELIKDPDTEQFIPIYRNPSAEYLMNTVMQDPQVKRAYLLEAQVEEWKWMKENETQYSSVDEAKKTWAMEIIDKYASDETKKLVENEAEYKFQSLALRNWEEWKKHNKVQPGSPSEEALALVAYNNYIAKSNRDATEQRLKDLKSPKSDLSSLLSTAYSAYMGFNMSPKMNAAAVAYSQIDASQTFEANPFKKMERKHQFDLNKMAIQHGYDMDKIYAKAESDLAMKQLELGMSGGGLAGGIIPGAGDANISGSLFGYDVDGDGKIDKSERSFVDGMAENKKDWQIFTQQYRGKELEFIEGITELFPEDSKGVRGYQGGGEFEYTYYDEALGGKSSTKTGTLEQMLGDLSNPDNKYAQLNGTELDSIVKNFENVYLSKMQTKDGAILSYALPTEDTKEGSSFQMAMLYENLQDFRTAFTDAKLKEQEVMKNVYNRVVAEDTATYNSSEYKGQPHSIPPIFLTQGEIDMLNQGVPWYKVHYASQNGKITEPIKDSNGNAVRRFVTENEYGQIYANMNQLTNDQRQELRNTPTQYAEGVPNESVNRDDYDFFLRESGYFNDDEYLAEQFWSWDPGEVIRGREDMTPLMTTEGKGWVYDREAAVKEGLNYYNGFKDNMNAVINKANAPDVDLNFSIRSYMQGQPQLGLGESNYPIYSTSYDVASKTKTSLQQTRELLKLVYETGDQDLAISLGDNRAQSFNEQQQNDSSEFARQLVDKMMQNYDTGFNDKTQSRTFFTTSYVEKSGGPNQPEEEQIFSMTLIPGSSHAKLYRDMFPKGDKGDEPYRTFVNEGITISAPSKYDTNPYKSTNVLMSHVERTIQNENVYESPMIQNGGSFTIHKNSRGQYVQTYTSMGIQEKNGVRMIVPDPAQTTVLNIIDPMELDALKITQLEALNVIAKQNIKSLK
jgi:hypothetical protein